MNSQPLLSRPAVGSMEGRCRKVNMPPLPIPSQLTRLSASDGGCQRCRQRQRRLDKIFHGP